MHNHVSMYILISQITSIISADEIFTQPYVRMNIIVLMGRYISETR